MGREASAFPIVPSSDSTPRLRHKQDCFIQFHQRMPTKLEVLVKDAQGPNNPVLRYAGTILMKEKTRCQ